MYFTYTLKTSYCIDKDSTKRKIKEVFFKKNRGSFKLNIRFLNFCF